MSSLHWPHWPPKLPRTLTLPETSLCYNADVTAKRYPNKTFLLYYDTPISFAQFKTESDAMAGFLSQVCHVKAGDRVLLYMQNCPQFIIAYYAVLRANAVVVPVNPMNRLEELGHYIEDTQASTVIASQELLINVRPYLDQPLNPLKHVVVSVYSDYLQEKTDLNIPDVLKVGAQAIHQDGLYTWQEATAHGHEPPALTVGSDDLCVMPYTSGTTGVPKGCMHTHRTVMSTLCASESWFSAKPDDVRLAALPLFHVTGMQSGMNSPLYTGSTVVLLARWDRELAAKCIERYKVSSFSATPTMIVDLLASPELAQYNFSSLRRLNGGGAAMPEAVAQQLMDRGLTYVEGYGLSETMAPSHYNPPDRPKKQCLGIPLFGVESYVVDPITLEEVPNGETGEILITGPQVFKGYWQNPQASQEVLINWRGKTFFRTGDLGREDAEGYFFMVDRLKRMINSSGYKVWPAEVELMLYSHPHVQEACVIAAQEGYRGETVKALVVIKDEHRGHASQEEMMAWAQNKMAAYKAPKLIEFVSHLPKSASGKILWRELQEQESKKAP